MQGQKKGWTYGESTGAPWATTVDFAEVCGQGKGLGVTQRNVDDAVVGEDRHAGDRSRLLAAAEPGGGDEEAGVLTPKGSRLPLLAGVIPKCPY